MPSPTTEIPFSRVLVEEFEAQFGPLDPPVRAALLEPLVTPLNKGLSPEGRARLAFYQFLHQRASATSTAGLAGGRSALCLSGGGIRSATFNLGVLQHLASLGLLPRLDFLSTVSGGGYIGSWLSAWIYNADQDLASVQHQLATVSRNDSKARDPACPEPTPIRNLRKYSRFLSPRAGILSGDSWTLLAVYLRNLLLTLSIFLPLLAAGVLVPRGATSALNTIYRSTHPTISPWAMELLLGTTLACMGTGLGMMLLTQTSLAIRLREVSGGRLAPLTSPYTMLWWLVPAVGGCMLLPIIALTPDLGTSLPIQPWKVGAIAALIMCIAFACRFAWQYSVTLKNAGGAVAPINFSNWVTRWPALALGSLLTLVAAVAILPAPPLFRSAMSLSAIGQHALFGGALSIVGIAPVAFFLVERWHRRALHVVAGMAAGAVTGVLLFLSRKTLESLSPASEGPLAGPAIANPLAPDDQWVARTATFGPPLAALSLFVGAAVFVGFLSRSRMAWDTDREWWARAGAVVLRFALLWTVVFGVVDFGPVWLTQIDVWGKSLVAAAGGVSGLVTIGLGASMHSPPPGTPDTLGSFLSRQALKFSAPVFILFFFAALSLGMGCLTLSLAGLDQTIDDLLTPEAQFTAFSNATLGTSGILALALLLFTILLSRCINSTRFSLHGMYRDRLIRAFLGASVRKPDRDPFTDFDDRDNIYFSKLKAGALRVRDFAVDPSTRKPIIVSDLARAASEDPADIARLLRFLSTRIQAVTGRAPAHFRGPDSGAALRDAIDGLNAVLFSESLGDIHPLDPELPIPDARLSPAVAARSAAWLMSKLPRWFEPQRIAAAAAAQDSPPAQRPFHIVNTALNIVAGSDNAWQDRKAASQTFSPYHSGCTYLGYRDVRAYGGPRGYSLGGAMTLSGAAVSPNQGYHSSPPIAFLLALFNVRLGAWCPNPGPAGEGSTALNAPRWTASLFPLLEALGQTSDASKWVYLSDGGHFDNLGLYEMVQRRCHSIVVVDAGADPDCELFDLGNAIRKVRVDLGIPIDLDDFDLHAKLPEGDADAPHPGSYAGIGTIRYDVVDGPGAVPGRLLYIKPCIYWREPADVLNYARSFKDFPHETTTDQWFSEPQFESYRQLGWHILKTITGGKDSAASMDELISLAQTHLKARRETK